MSPTAIDCMPDALPPELRPSNWPELGHKDARKVWEHYEQFLFKHGYHILGSSLYNTLGAGVTEIPHPAVDPFHPKDNETFIHHYQPKELRSTRTCSSFQPARSVAVYFGIDSFQRQIVFKALMHDSRELKVLRMLTSHSLRESKRNRVIPVLKFLETRDFVIVVMASWGWFWDSPPCGNMTTRGEMATKISEGLVWLHEQGVAHGDIHPGNIVINHDNARERPASPENDFRKNSNLEYAFIDFGAAQIFPIGHPPFASPETVPPDPFSSPEQTEQQPKQGLIDVFAADVYNLGKILEAELTAALGEYGENHLPIQTYQQYRSLLLAMTDPRPGDRPTAANVLSTLEAIMVNGEKQSNISSTKISAVKIGSFYR